MIDVNIERYKFMNILHESNAILISRNAKCFPSRIRSVQTIRFNVSNFSPLSNSDCVNTSVLPTVGSVSLKNRM